MAFPPAEITLLAVALVRQRHGNPRPSPPRPAFDPAAVRIYFFGVGNRQAGHHWLPASRYRQDADPYGPTGCPWGDRQVDSILCRQAPRLRAGDYSRAHEVEGLARLHHKDGWTAIAYWDRSGADQRSGCNSNFVAEGTFTFDEMMRLARHHFPHIIERTRGKFEIRLEES